MDPILQTDIKSLPFLHRGKVRDLYAVGDDKLLVVQTDRLSAFDVILPDPIPGKGEELTRLSFFWFDKLRHIVPNHLTGVDPFDVITDPEERKQVEGRAMVVKKCKPLLIEAVVRGCIIGSGWKDYQKNGSVCGIKLPPGLEQAQKLLRAIFTPASKAPIGEHDENITFEDMTRLLIPTLQEYNLGKAKTEAWAQSLAEQIRSVSLQLYTEAAAYAAQCGIIIADTKFEFGLYQNERGEIELILIDEVLTPDSSRFWPKSEYRTGISPPSFDKQFVRDWLETQPWNKKAPAPKLPPDVLRQTSEKYREAARLLITR